jgi:hypothetical protein
MDAERLFSEQIAEQGYELVSTRWYEGDTREKAGELAGKKIASDTDLAGARNVYADLVDLHYPLIGLEIARMRWLASETDELFTDFAQTVKPGETEKEIAAKLHSAHIARGLEVDVLIVGSDERCFKYRHPIATDKRLDKYLMLHTSARRWGLHCNLTRFVHFGKPPGEVRDIYDAAAYVEACVFQMLKPGIRFADIFDHQKRWYAQKGYPEEWKNHFQGGPTGYVIVDAGRCMTNKVVQVNQPFEWFITITGTKMGELSMVTNEGLEISSFINSNWPGMTVHTRECDIRVPDLLIL